MFGSHRSSYRYWLSRPRQPDAKRVVLFGLVREVHHASNGSAGARSIADMVSTKGVPLSRWRASKLMKDMNIISCQQPEHCYNRATKEHVDIANHLVRQFAITEPNQVWCGDVTFSVPGVQGEHGRSNEPRVCLEY